ncbi:unnamed protein product, partial [Ectocarpus sp. 12 AP-2014]
RKRGRAGAGVGHDPCEQEHDELPGGEHGDVPSPGGPVAKGSRPHRSLLIGLRYPDNRTSRHGCRSSTAVVTFGVKHGVQNGLNGVPYCLRREMMLCCTCSCLLACSGIGQLFH